MNRDQAEGAKNVEAAKTQQKAGKAADSSARHAKLVAQKSEVRMQQASDQVKAALKGSRHS